jgi:hypothetical protein
MAFLFPVVGAKQPSYLVTADDVDSLLAIEVQPLDDRKRKVNPLCLALITSMWQLLSLALLESIA